MERIASLQNTKIKNLVKLQKASERREQKLFLVEGHKEIGLAVGAGYKPDSVFWCPDLGLSANLVDNFNCKLKFEISSEVFAKVAYREGSDGLLAVFHTPDFSLENVTLPDNPLVLVLEAVEKPGNLGAILRTADAMQASAVVVCDPRTDIFNPNVIRSSIGCVFTNQVVASSNEAVYNWLKMNNIQSYAAALKPDSLPYQNFDFTKPTAFIMGTEADGLTDFWLAKADSKIIIPMLGKIDSLNVSVSTAVLAFEARRQRGF